jgi:hypothetical protein
MYAYCIWFWWFGAVPHPNPREDMCSSLVLSDADREMELSVLKQNTYEKKRGRRIEQGSHENTIR